MNNSVFTQAVPLEPRLGDLAAILVTGGRVELPKPAFIFPTRRADEHAFGGKFSRSFLHSLAVEGHERSCRFSQPVSTFQVKLADQSRGTPCRRCSPGHCFSHCGNLNHLGDRFRHPGHFQYFMPITMQSYHITRSAWPARASWLAMLAALYFAGGANAQTNTTVHRFENIVRRYEAADRTNPPPRNAILLAGDSQFYRWKTVAEDLPGYTVINRGIDSFQTSDLLYFADRLVLPYHARLIVLHVGGNDVHGGKSPERVLADFKALVAKIRAVQPSVPIAFSSLTPGPGRREEFDRRKETNGVIKNYIATQPGLLFIDLWDAMLTPDGQPREDLWVADGVHPNHAGYLLRVRIMRPILGEPDKRFQ